MFQTFHRMGASQERAAFFSATLLVVTRHRGCIPAGRQADGKFTLPSRFALYFCDEKKAQFLAVRPGVTRFTCVSTFCALLA
jgi:hypothetical protein